MVNAGKQTQHIERVVPYQLYGMLGQTEAPYFYGAARVGRAAKELCPICGFTPGLVGLRMHLEAAMGLGHRLIVVSPWSIVDDHRPAVHKCQVQRLSSDIVPHPHFYLVSLRP